MGGVGSGRPMRGWGSAGSEGQWAWGRSGYPGKLWYQLQAEVQCRLVVGIPVVMSLVAWARGGYSSMVWPAQLMDRYPALCGSGTELWPGTARGVESPAEWSSGSVDLCLQLLHRISGSAHEVCGSVSIAIFHPIAYLYFTVE
jgi:hypothetical protein